MKLVTLLFFFISIACVGAEELNKGLFLYKYHKAPQTWVIDQIKGDLESFNTEGITSQAIQATYQKVVYDCLSEWEGYKPTLFAHYRVINNIVYRRHGEVNYFDSVLAYLCSTVGLPNLEFILCLGDGAPESYHKQDFMIMDDFSLQAPVLARCTLSSAKYICLIPDYASFSVNNLIDHVLDANAKSPWESKIFKACWRGVPSDVHVNGIDRFSYEEISSMYANKARYVISVMSNLYPDYVDAGITSMYPHTPEFNKFLINSQVIKSEMSIPDHIKHACLPCLDGWMSTYPGYIWRLASNSLVLKQDSDHILWFFKGLKSYEHYVPLDSCCRDLIEKVNWVINNPIKSKSIAENATKFVMNNLKSEDAYVFTARFFNCYSKLQKINFIDLEQDTLSNPEWIIIFKK